MKKLLHIALGLTLACFLGNTASAQNGTSTKKEVIKKEEIKKAEKVEVAPAPQKLEPQQDPTTPKTKTKVRTRAISIDEEGVDGEDRNTRNTGNGSNAPQPVKKAKVAPKREDG